MEQPGQKTKMKEIFMEKISEILSSQSKNNKMITDEGYQNIIRKLKLLNEKPMGYQSQLESKNDYRLLKTHEILIVENDGVIHERLVKPVDGKKLRYVTLENIFDILLDHHQKSGHGKRDIMYAEIKDLYANLTQKHCQTLVECCEQCQKNKLRPKKGIVVKPEDMNKRCQIDIIDL